MADAYLDNDVSLTLVPLLVYAGHHVTTTRDLALIRATDDSQLLLAARNQWILITLNRRDFTLLHEAWLAWPSALGVALPAHAGILVLDHAPPNIQGGAVASILSRTQGTLANELLWWHRHDGWRRRAGGKWESYG